MTSGRASGGSPAGRPLNATVPPQALHDAESFEILIEATPWIDVHRAWTLASGSLRYADALCVATAERHATALLTADTRIERSGAPITC